MTYYLMYWHIKVTTESDIRSFINTLRVISEYCNISSATVCKLSYVFITFSCSPFIFVDYPKKYIFQPTRIIVSPLHDTYSLSRLERKLMQIG
jgi:hypothetical protein